MILGGLGNLWSLLLSQVILLQPENTLAQIYNILQNLLLLFATFFS